MEEKILKELLSRKLSQRQIAKELECSQTTVRYWLKRHQLSTKKENYYLCTRCGENDSNRFYGHQKSVCKRCRNIEDKQKRQRYKEQAIEYLGSKCNICGYDKCNQALEFHHLDQSKKSDKYVSMRNWSFESKKEELDKCILLCCRCHREVHYLQGS